MVSDWPSVIAIKIIHALYTWSSLLTVRRNWSSVSSKLPQGFSFIFFVCWRLNRDSEHFKISMDIAIPSAHSYSSKCKRLNTFHCRIASNMYWSLMQTQRYAFRRQLVHIQLHINTHMAPYSKDLHTDAQVNIHTDANIYAKSSTNCITWRHTSAKTKVLPGYSMQILPFGHYT